MRSKTTTWNMDELVMLIALVSGLDPDEYSSDDAKATIYRCKALAADPPKYMRVIPS